MFKLRVALITLRFVLITVRSAVNLLRFRKRIRFHNRALITQSQIAYFFILLFKIETEHRERVLWPKCHFKIKEACVQWLRQGHLFEGGAMSQRRQSFESL